VKTNVGKQMTLTDPMLPSLETLADPSSHEQTHSPSSRAGLRWGVKATAEVGLQTVITTHHNSAGINYMSAVDS
jgi:hypothetical protein